MRTLFFILLAGNVLVAAWLMADRPDQPPEAPPVPANVPELELLSERDEPPSQSRPAVADNGRARECFMLGPFETEADARAVAGRLGDDLLARETRRSQAEAEIGHWVYLPAMPSRERALEVARELSEAGLRDYYVVTSGDEENTISLGLYRDRSNAEGRVASIREMGFDAEMRRRTESVPRYWLDVATPREGERDWSSMLTGYPDASASRADCPVGE